MPGVVAAEDGQKKRKRTSVIDKHTSSRKRTKSDQHEATAQQVQQLEGQIQESQKHLNNIASLLKLAQSEVSSSTTVAPACIALCRVFCRLLADGRFSKNKHASEKELMVVSWLKARLKEYRQLLAGVLRDGESAKQEVALTLGMQLVKEEITASKSAAESLWRTGTFPELVAALLDSPGGSLIGTFVEKYVQPFDDVRQHAFQNMADVVARQDPSDGVIAQSIHLLSMLEMPESANGKLTNNLCDNQDDTTPKIKISAHKKVAQQAWLAILRRPINKEQRKQLLDTMTHNIVPFFQSPELLMDFLTDAFNVGGATSLLALSGLFHLMSQRNLDYPSFYHKLYSLLDENLLHSKHRSRFFRLLNVFMSSTHLPANLVASFIKRLSRLALHGPPAGIVSVIPWIYNMFKMHPTCTFMMHKVPRTKADGQRVEEYGEEDSFDMSESDPNESGAIDSCVWELVTLQSHYHPNVASLARIISEQFTKQSYNLEDFLDHSYKSLLDAELGKDLKKTPVTEFEIPKKVFVEQNGDTRLETLLSRLIEDI